MPANLIHCQSCRALLNAELRCDTVEIPEFQPLPEISAMVEVEPIGFYVSCPDCSRELKISRKYCGKRVQCRFCEQPFLFDSTQSAESTEGAARRVAFYCSCPHCSETLRVAAKYLGRKVACRHCDGHLHFVEQATA